eukprot:scaffold18079_cov65-Phaeocystis_antarctica.AAC.5
MAKERCRANGVSLANSARDHRVDGARPPYAAACDSSHRTARRRLRPQPGALRCQSLAAARRLRGSQRHAVRGRCRCGGRRTRPVAGPPSRPALA